MRKRINEFYKGSYLIALYDGDDEELVALWDNAHEMSVAMGVSLTLACSKICHYLKDANKKERSLLYNGDKCKLHLIPVADGI